MTQRLFAPRTVASIVWCACLLWAGHCDVWAQATKLPQRPTTGSSNGARQPAPAQGSVGSASTPAVRQPSGGTRPGPLASANVADPEVQVLTVSAEMRALLQQWERKTSGFTSMESKIFRREYDHVFFMETRSEGKLYYTHPDRGRIDFDVASEAFMSKPSTKIRTDNMKPYRVVNADATRWISTGEYIFILDVANKQYRQIEIPPASRGKNITRSPLPFLFGMKAEDAISRFVLSFGEWHDPENKNKKGAVINVIAHPRDPAVAREYNRAEVIMDANSFLPIHLRIVDPSGNKETVYQFHQVEVGATWLTNPFKIPTFGGWEKLSDTKAEPEQAPRQPVPVTPRVQ